PEGPPGNRPGDGVAAALVVEEVTAGGFTLVKVIEDWPGRGPLKSYCAIFRKPEVGPVNGEALRRYRFGKPDAAHARLNLDAPRALLTEGLERTRTALEAHV